MMAFSFVFFCIWFTLRHSSHPSFGLTYHHSHHQKQTLVQGVYLGDVVTMNMHHLGPVLWEEAD